MNHAVTVNPIRSARDLREALERIEVLWGAKRGTADGDELDVLADLIEAYETRHHPIGSGSPLRTLRHLMTSNQLTQQDLPEIGSQGVVSEILNGKRELNVKQIRALAIRFKLSPAAFV